MTQLFIAELDNTTRVVVGIMASVSVSSNEFVKLEYNHGWLNGLNRSIEPSQLIWFDIAVYCPLYSCLGLLELSSICYYFSKALNSSFVASNHKG